MLDEPENVLRSLRRYLALMIGSPPWSVRLQRARVEDDDRPVAVLEQSGPLGTLQARAGGMTQGDVHKQATYTLTCYPELGDTAAESRQVAGLVAALLDAGVTRGLVSDDVPPQNIGAPFRFPIWDYTGVAVTGAGRAGPADPYTYGRIDSTFNTRPVQDALDELRFTVVATLRCDWWQSGRVPPPAPIAERMPGHFEGRGVI